VRPSENEDPSLAFIARGPFHGTCRTANVLKVIRDSLRFLVKMIDEASETARNKTPEALGMHC
jgi:hypothetical protein